MGSNSNITTIAHGVKVEGDFTSNGDVQIEGEVIGNVKTAGHLQIGEGARIHADITSSSASIAGEVQGSVKVDGHLELASTSMVQGDVVTATLSVSSGAQLNGKMSMGGAMPARAAVEEDEE